MIPLKIGDVVTFLVGRIPNKLRFEVVPDNLTEMHELFPLTTEGVNWVRNDGTPEEWAALRAAHALSDDGGPEADKFNSVLREMAKALVDNRDKTRTP